MSNLIDELIELTEQVGHVISVPRIREIILPPAGSATQSKYSKFGLLVLEDSSAGFFYRLLDQTKWDAAYSAEEINACLRDTAGIDPIKLAAGLRTNDPLARGLGMAAINAVTQYVYKTIGFQPPMADRGNHAALETAWGATPRVGMIGYFGPLIGYLQSQGIHTTVIELNESLFHESDTLHVSGDMSLLVNCDPIYCTASTLLNHSLESILEQLGKGRFFELIGPTCGCFADPFFSRGVNQVGGSLVVDTPAAMEKLRTLQTWGDSVQKFTMDNQAYPGFDAILRALRSG